jgi:hypothetical protein
VWEGEVVPGDDPAQLTFQVEVIGTPPSGHTVTNVATLVDADTVGSLPLKMAWATLQLMPSQGAMSTSLAVPPSVQAAQPVSRPPVISTGTRLQAEHSVLLPLTLFDTCSAMRGVDPPFGLQIAALHQIGLAPPGAVQDTHGGVALSQTESGEMALSDEAFVSLVDALEQSGAAWTRVHLPWESYQPEPPPAQFRMLDWYDRRLALVASTGVRIIATVADAPEWAAEYPCAPIHADRLDEFGQFLNVLVHRYKQPPYNIHHWELINEPDSVQRRPDANGLGCWADASTDRDGLVYTEMLAVAHAAIKAADPEATILMGGVAHDWFTAYGGPFDRSFPDDVMQHRGDIYIDILNFHYFPDFYAEWERWVPEGNPPTCGVVDDGEGAPYEAWGIDLAAKTRHYRNRLSTCYGVDKPIWVTELAEHGYAGDEGSLQQQARYVIQGYARGLSAGAENIIWYALTTPNDSYEQGLLFDDWMPKPAYYAYQTMTAELGGYEYVSTEATVDGEAYSFRDACGRKKTVAWGSGSLALAPAQRARIVDRWGTESYALDGGDLDTDGAANGSITLALSPEPLFVSAER